MVGFRLRHTLSPHGTVSRGVCRCDAEGFLAGVTEHTKIAADGDGGRSRDETGRETPLPGDTIVSMNLWGFQPSIFPRLAETFRAFRQDPRSETGEFFLPAVVDELLGAGKARVKVLPTPEVWLGLTYPQDKPLLVRGIAEKTRRGDYPSPLWR
jgi:hypothetical protein